MSELVEIDNLDRLLDTISANDTVVVEFGAVWCGPCRSFLPHYKKFAEANPDIVCVKVDVDTDPGFVQRFRIQSVPQVFLFKNGEYVKHLESRTVIKLQEELNAS